MLLTSLAWAFQDFPNKDETKTAQWLVNVTKSIRLPPFSGFPSLNFNELEHKIDRYAQLSEKISENREATKLIRRIYEGFKGEDGRFLRATLVLAAQDRGEREAFLRAIKYEKGLICWPGFDLIGEKIWYGSPKVSFGNTQLKADINSLEKYLFPDPGTPEWLKNLEVSDLDVYEPYFKFFLELEPKSNELLEFAIRYAQFLSCQFTLVGFLKSLNLWLADRTNGIASILAAAKPRTAH
jgi:hypothetical protein